jgi:hypothetical protein
LFDEVKHPSAYGSVQPEVAYNAEVKQFLPESLSRERFATKNEFTAQAMPIF